MIVNIENRERLISPDEKLSSKEADRVASSLITAFRARLYSLEEFRQASSNDYLNIPEDQDRTIKSPSRRLQFSFGIDRCEVDYVFSDKENSFVIVKNTFRVSGNEENDDPVLERTDEITLKSSRHIDQKPIRTAKVGWHYPVGNKFYNPDIPNPQTNTPFAVEKALEMLAGLSPQAPQK